MAILNLSRLITLSLGYSLPAPSLGQSKRSAHQNPPFRSVSATAHTQGRAESHTDTLLLFLTQQHPRPNMRSTALL